MEPSEFADAQTVRRMRRMLRTLAETLIAPALHGELEASDLVQQTFLEAQEHAARLGEFDDGQLFGWLRIALQHNVLDAVKHLRTQKNDMARRVRLSALEDSFVRLERVLAADQTSPSEVATRQEQTASLLSALQQLPDKQRRAVIMKHLQGHSLREIADNLELSEAAVAGLLHRGRQRLMQVLEKTADGD